MGSPYLEVVRTYVTRWQVVVSGGLLLAWLLLLLVVNSNYRRTPDPKSITPVIVPLLSVFLGSLCVHAMQMLYNWRTRLLPGHAKYTLIVASSIGVLACGFSGAGIAISTTATLHGAMALSFLTFVVSAWAVWGSRLSSLVPLLLYWVVWFDPPARIVERALTDSRSIVSVGILLTSGAALFLLACRWIRFCRDQGTPGDPSVPKWLALDASPDRQGMLETGGGPIARFLQWQRERRLDAVLAEGRGSLRFCYRRLKAAIGEPPLGLATMVLTLGTTLIGSQLFASRHRTEDAYSIVYACVWLVLARLVFGHSIEWKSNLQRESARPITRRRILLLQMSVTLCETVSVWLGLCGGVPPGTVDQRLLFCMEAGPVVSTWHHRRVYLGRNRSDGVHAIRIPVYSTDHHTRRVRDCCELAPDHRGCHELRAAVLIITPLAWRGCGTAGTRAHHRIVQVVASCGLGLNTARDGTMGHAYLEVARTYVGRWGFVLAATMHAFCLLLAALKGGDKETLGIWPVIPILGTFMWCVAGWSILLKQQTANYRSRLTPHFTRPHLAVAAMACVILCSPTTVILAATTPTTALGAAALVFALYALGAWASCARLSRLLLLAGIVLMLNPTCRYMTTATICDHAPIVALSVLLASWCMLLWLGFRLARLHEEQRDYCFGTLEDPDYERPFLGTWFDRGSRERPGIALLETWFGRRTDFLLACPTERMGYGTRRLRLAVGRPPTGLVVMGVTAIATLLLPGMQHREYPYLTNGVVINLVVLISASFVANWRRVIQRELVRPMTRSKLFRQVLLAFTLEAIDTWLGFCAGVVVSWALIAPQGLRDPVVWSAMLAIGVGLWAFFGGLACLIRVRRDSDRILLCIVWGFLVLGVMLGLEGGDPSAKGYLWSCIPMFLIGTVLSIVAYRLWLRADWD